MLTRGDNIDGYKVLFPHNENDYAETYRVLGGDGKLKFLKRIKNSDTCEMEIVKRLSHHNLFCVTDCKSDYYVTNFVSGETLDKRLIRENDFNVYNAKIIVKSVLEALQYLHEQKEPIVHNAICPQNILLDLSGELGDLKLVGFSHARFLNQQPEKPDIKRLNPFYLAPERFDGVFSVQTDLYSVGVLLYYLVFGMLPWYFDTAGKNAAEIDAMLAAERKKRIKIPNIEKFELDASLLTVIDKALKNDVSQRFQTAGEFLEAMETKAVVSKGKPKEVLEPDKHLGGGFNDVAGMKDLKELLRKSVINILRNTEKAKKYRLSIPNGMLLYGPPGCGKSFFAEKFAEETGYNYVYVKSSDLASIYIHGTQEKIAELFNDARKNAPTILCFDEFDSFVPSRDGVRNSSQSGEVNEFLSQLNNCGQDGVFVIASTNKPDLIDNAILRRGRIDRIIYLPVPDAEARQAMFELHLKDRPIDSAIDYGHLSALTQNYVASDIAFIANEAAMRAAENDALITQALIEQVISENQPSVKPSTLRYYEGMKEKLEGMANAQPRKIGF
ncbi:MAG: AAA family ATPase [Bacteroidales bacterium]|nr:AAA family ATPase [Bacteroidales bacterium]